MTHAAIAVEGRDAPHLRTAVVDGGGQIVAAADATGLIWADPQDGAALSALLAANPKIDWVQLPFAGIEPFIDALDHDRVWTCGKGVYAEPVAEHALALLLAGMRHVGGYARERTWTTGIGVNLLGAKVCILGGGEITRSLLRLLEPFGCEVTVVRRTPEALPGAARVLPTESLLQAVRDTDALILALALTPETEGIIDGDVLGAMAPHAWVVNVARGRHIVTDDLVAALTERTIGGAALDVTDPEPLPDDHPLWNLRNAIITPHTANTPAMGAPLLARRVRENVARYAAGEPLLGLVDVEAGY
ncbi:MAG: phosphoglycerate dehydrogenase-like enzyme [Glaciecola sp.]|jgi:phosphoglycerate dehydrogenase-like enzyme